MPIPFNLSKSSNKYVYIRASTCRPEGLVTRQETVDKVRERVRYIYLYIYIYIYTYTGTESNCKNEYISASVYRNWYHYFVFAFNYISCKNLFFFYGIDEQEHNLSDLFSLLPHYVGIVASENPTEN